jgi:hypothetical protein
MKTNCGGCDASWTGTSICHCGSCHRSFSGIGLFDKHRSQYGERGACVDPATLTGRDTGQPLMHHRDGMWRGPETTDEGKAKLKALRNTGEAAA